MSLIAIWIKRTRDQDEVEQHSITPEALHTLLASNQEVLVFDVRQPLDLLADPEIIVGAKRIPPKDLLENPTLIPKEKDSVVYCTCPDDKTSRVDFASSSCHAFPANQIPKGGLAGWKAKGYPVERYENPFPSTLEPKLDHGRGFPTHATIPTRVVSDLPNYLVSMTPTPKIMDTRCARAPHLSAGEG